MPEFEVPTLTRFEQDSLRFANDSRRHLLFLKQSLRGAVTLDGDGA